MKYIVKKTCTLIITLFIVSLLAFLAFQIIPGDPTTDLLGRSHERGQAGSASGAGAGPAGAGALL